MARSNATVVRDATLDPATLDPDDHARLSRELYDVHRKIFDGVDKAAFDRYVVQPEGARTRIQVFRSERGDAVGYIAIHGFERHVEGRPSLIVRSEVGLLRQFRGSAPQARFVLLECLRLWWQFLGKRKYVFACPVHPSSYFGVTRRAGRSWPRPGTQTPPKIAQTMSDLADSFGLDRVEGSGPLVRNVGWITYEDDKDRRYWRHHDAQEVQFYCEQNPDYSRGHGLLMLIPLTFGLVAGGALRQLVHQVRRGLRPGSSRKAGRTPRRA